MSAYAPLYDRETGLPALGASPGLREPQIDAQRLYRQPEWQPLDGTPLGSLLGPTDGQWARFNLSRWKPDW
jgi:hypothetical protein